MSYIVAASFCTDKKIKLAYTAWPVKVNMTQIAAV